MVDQFGLVGRAGPLGLHDHASVVVSFTAVQVRTAVALL